MLFDGFPENPNEDLRAKVGNFIRESLKVSGDIQFSRIHRLGKPPHLLPYPVKKPRPIIARFHFFPDRERVWKASWSLKHPTYKVSEDFSETVLNNRRTLYPLFQAAKKDPTVKRCGLKADRLTIDGKVYSVHTIESIPKKLQWASKGERFIPQINCTFFFGQQSILSNFHAAPFESDGLKFTCSEQFYLYHKCLFFNDDSTALAILRTHDPRKMKSLSCHIKNIDESKWRGQAKTTMEKACALKFSQNPNLKQKLLSTQGELVEANKHDKFFSCGLALADPNVLEKSLWLGENILGEILEKLRDGLKDKD